METIRELKAFLEREMIRYSKIIYLRRHKRTLEKLQKELNTTSRDKVIKAINLLNETVEQNGFRVAREQAQKERIIQEQQLKDEQARAERERAEREAQAQVQARAEREAQAQLITKEVATSHGNINKIVTSHLNNQIIGDLNVRNLVMKVTDIEPIDYDKYKDYLREVHNQMPNDKKIMINILGKSGWYTLKKRYLTKEELSQYANDDNGAEPGMADSLIALYAVSTSIR